MLSYIHTGSANPCQVILREKKTNELTITWGGVTTGVFNLYILVIQSQEGITLAERFINRDEDISEVKFDNLFPGRLYDITCIVDSTGFQMQRLRLRTSKSKLYHR